MTTPPPYSVGQQVAYTYTLTNTGGSAAARTRHRGRPRASARNHLPGRLHSTRGPRRRAAARTRSNRAKMNPAGFLVNTASVTAETVIGQVVTAGPVQVQIPVATDVAVTKSWTSPHPWSATDVTFTSPPRQRAAVATGVRDLGRRAQRRSGGQVIYLSSTAPREPTMPATGAGPSRSLSLDQTETLTITATVNTGRPPRTAARALETDQPDRDPTDDSASARQPRDPLDGHRGHQIGESHW